MERPKEGQTTPRRKQRGLNVGGDTLSSSGEAGGRGGDTELRASEEATARWEPRDDLEGSQIPVRVK